MFKFSGKLNCMTHSLIVDTVRFSIIVLGFLMLPIGRALALACFFVHPSIQTSTHTNTQTSLLFVGQGRRWDGNT